MKELKSKLAHGLQTKTFRESCEALYSWAPIADQLKDLDKEIVINSMDIQWQNIMINFVKLIKPLDANVR